MTTLGSKIMSEKWKELNYDEKEETGDQTKTKRKELRTIQRKKNSQNRVINTSKEKKWREIIMLKITQMKSKWTAVKETRKVVLKTTESMYANDDMRE